MVVGAEMLVMVAVFEVLVNLLLTLGCRCDK